ncbi:MAG TPA: TIGR03118 family protein [Opitutus sp.]|nr:TIGR03118 family protein [Opitutus sp.]
MKPHRFERMLCAPGLAVLALGLGAQRLAAQLNFSQTNLVSDVPGMAMHTDANLVNPWGVAYSASSPIWVSDADAGKATVYTGGGSAVPLVVDVKLPSGGAAAPTGQIFNSNASAFNGDRFIFATEDGTIAGWRGPLGTSTETLFDSSGAGASYKGLAVSNAGANTYLYAANFTQGRIDVMKSTGAPDLPGSFTDPNLPAGYAPFNVQNVNGTLYVTYAHTSDEVGEEQAGAGLGVVDAYDLNGNLLQRVAAGGPLNAPWGVTVAPAGFGKFGGDLLVGNFGDGTINVFEPASGALLGTLTDAHGNPIVIDGLWSIAFGNGATGARPDWLYFTAGIDDEAHGLVGRLSAIPEPAMTGAFGALGLAALCGLSWWRRRIRAGCDGATSG